MKRVEPQLQFQGSAQSQGFNAIQAPDVSPLLRQNMQTEQNNLDNFRQAALQNIKLQDLSYLANFSETLGNSLATFAKQKSEADMEAGIQQAYLDGLPQQTVQAYDEQITKLQKAHEGIQEVADKAEASGAPVEGVQQIRNLSGWKKYGYVMAQTQMLANNVGSWLASQLESDNTTVIQVGNDKFTPAQATTPAQKAAASAQLRMQYMRENGLTGVNPALLNKHFFPQLRQAEESLLNNYRNKFLKEQQEIEQENLISTFANASNKGELFTTTILDLSRNGLTRKQARDLVFQNITTVEELNAVGAYTSWDGKLTNAEKFKSDFIARRSEILRQEMSDESLKDGLLDQQAENFAEEVIASFGDNPAPEDVVDQFIAKSRQLYSDRVSSKLEQYKTNRSLEARTKEDQNTTLEQLYVRNELTLSEVMSGKYSADVIATWKGRAQEQDNMRTPQIKEARTPAVNAIANELRLRSGLLQKSSTPHWSFELAKAHALRQLDAKAKVYMQSMKNPEEAYSRAAQDIIASIEKDNPQDKQGFGTYSVGKSGNGDFVRWSQSGTGGNGGLSQARSKVSTIRSTVASGGIAAVTDKKLIDRQTAEALVNPDSPIPTIIDVIKNALPNGKEMSDFDIIDNQLRLHGLPARQRPWTQQTVDYKLSPQQKALLNRTPDTFRTRRALTEGGFVGPGQERQAIQYIANSLGVDPIDVATFINYETGGRLVSGSMRSGLDTWGGNGGRYLGWIQFSPENQQKYGVSVGMSPMQMAESVVKYLKSAGIKPGDSLDMLYQAVQAPAYLGTARSKGRNIGADSNGSISGHVARMRREHSGPASEWLAYGSNQRPTSVWRDPRLMSAPGRKLLSQWQMTSGFGAKESFRANAHEGNDYSTPVGTKLSFKQPGVVLDAKPGSYDRNSNGGYGGYIDVRLSDGNVIRIGHLSDVMVTKGQRLRPKQIAALTGNTGRSTGPHAHIEHLSGPTGLQETMKGKRNPSWIASQVYADI